ncbi:MAG: Leucyl-tRNA synthetase, partial [uncultured bacterium]
NYKMRDWVYSRQRYWGEPIPIVHCEKCGAVGVPEDQLPVMLPEVENYEPTGTGESPLANISEWVNTTCPKCGGPGKRETNTMPQWGGSSWYYLRYIDPKNNESLVGKELEKKWMPVDLYVGGAEHATRHLLYARFWHKFLYDIGVVSTIEPFKKLVHVGLIMAEDGRKMSKRWNNVINPDDVIAEFGADAMRLYEMFMGPFTQSVAWSTSGVSGVRRFLEKVWKIQERIMNYESGITNKKIDSLIHKTIKKVTSDIENFRFNTAISQMMICLNALEKEENISMIHYSYFLILLSPFAPHIAEELWEKLGYKDSIFLQSWPVANEKYLQDDEIEMVVQVNGKVRDRLMVAADVNEDGIKEAALKSEKVKLFTSGKEIKKIIFVPGKLINIVVGE